MNKATIEIRKYPNRRYYNTRDSRHVTLEEIRDLVRDGHDIKVIDSRTDEDISVAVLTQILLEIESPKLAFFPADFLQHLIRVNTDMFKAMTQSYFKNSLASFVKSAEGGPAGAAAGAGMPFPTSLEDWQKLWMGMLPHAPAAAGAGDQPGNAPPRKASRAREASDRVATLSRQMEEMRRTLDRLQKRRRK